MQVAYSATPVGSRWNGNPHATHVTATFIAKTIIIGKSPSLSDPELGHSLREIIIPYGAVAEPRPQRLWGSNPKWGTEVGLMN